MPHRTAAGRILLALVVATASVLVWNVVAIRSAADAFDAPRGSIVTNRESSMISFQKSWESAECGTVTVLTVCGIDYDGNPIPGGETVAQCLARHRAQVAFLMAECPPA